MMSDMQKTQMQQDSREDEIEALAHTLSAQRSLIVEQLNAAAGRT